MLQKDVIAIIEDFAPLETQLSYDKCGLKVGDVTSEVTSVLTCLDINEKVVEEAEKKGCNLIIEHHPSIWHSWNMIDTRYPKVRALLKAAEKNISVYSAHTNIDVAVGGLNDFFAQKIGLKDIKSTSEGRIGTLPKPMTLKKYADYIAEELSDSTVKIIGDPLKQIKTVACINGAGGGEEETVLEFSLLSDVFVTGEVKYNVARLSKDIGYAIIEVSHFSAENGFSTVISDLIKKSAPNLPVYKAESLTHPYQ